MYLLYSLFVVMFLSLAQKIPGGPRVRVAIGTTLMLAACAYPVFGKAKETKRGHDLFSQERPEAILRSQEIAAKEGRKLAKQQQ
jgi:hypothetical protein